MEVEKIDSNENFIRFVNQYQNLVFSICLKLTGDYFVSEDLTQETFLSAYKNIHKFDGQSEKAWICRIASNKSIDWLKSAKRKEVFASEADVCKEEVSSENDPLYRVLNKEVFENVKRCCEELKPPYCEVATEFFVKGKTTKEIAKQSDVPLNTVQTRLYRAREMLKENMGKEVP